MVGWYLALAASQQSSVRLLQFAPNSLECLDANHSFSFRLGLQAADCSIQLFSLRRYNRPKYLTYICFITRPAYPLCSMYILPSYTFRLPT